MPSAERAAASPSRRAFNNGCRRELDVHEAREARQHREQEDLDRDAARLAQAELAVVALRLLAGRRLEAHDRTLSRHAVRPGELLADRDLACLAAGLCLLEQQLDWYWYCHCARPRACRAWGCRSWAGTSGRARPATDRRACQGTRWGSASRRRGSWAPCCRAQPWARRGFPHNVPLLVVEEHVLSWDSADPVDDDRLLVVGDRLAGPGGGRSERRDQSREDCA